MVYLLSLANYNTYCFEGKNLYLFLDIDECVDEDIKCDLTVSTCHNIEGGYECHCIDGYQKNETNQCDGTKGCNFY